MRLLLVGFVQSKYLYCFADYRLIPVAQLEDGKQWNNKAWYLKWEEFQSTNSPTNQPYAIIAQSTGTLA